MVTVFCPACKLSFDTNYLRRINLPTDSVFHSGHQGLRAVVPRNHKLVGLADVTRRNVPIIMEFDVFLLKRSALDVKGAIVERRFPLLEGLRYV